MAVSRYVLAAAIAGFTGGLAGFGHSALASDGQPALPGPDQFSLSSAAAQAALDAPPPGQDAQRYVGEVRSALDASPVAGTAPTKKVAEPSAGQFGNLPVYLDEDAAAATTEKPNVHGFIELPFKTAYVTPRGLVVENKGVVFQPVGGIIFPLGDLGPLKGFTFVTGIWNSVNGHQGDPRVGAWNEMDIFESFSGNLFDKFSLTLTYGAWNFPNSTLNKPRTEHNIDLKISYDDTKVFGDNWFALHPYVDIFYEVSGSSTVVLGRQGSTGYLEIGIVPTYTYKGIANWPLTFTFPVYFSVGQKHYWGDAQSGGTPDGNLGVFSASVDVSVPLNFIPSRYGFWHADAGFSYYNLMNDNLLRAGTIVSGNTGRSVYQGSLGVGVNF